MVSPGLYESLVTDLLESDLAAIDSNQLVPERSRLQPAEAADRLALHLGKVVFRALSTLNDVDRLSAGVDLIQSLIALVDERVPNAHIAEDQVAEAAEVLRGAWTVAPDGNPDRLPQPCTPLLDTALLTNARSEPRVGVQVSREIESADRIDLLIAFIRASGVKPLLEKLRRHCEKRATETSLRVLTTTYTGSTELKALEMLKDLGAEVRISYDTTSSRLHAKAWHFHRESGSSTAFIGSSNLTYSAQETGIEWNVRVSGVRNPDVIRKLSSVFEAYWESGDFVPFEKGDFLKNTQSQTADESAVFLSPVEIRLEPFQERLLEQIAVSRKQGRHRNLLVAATGTGKTVMAAVDYSRLRSVLPRHRLLFVAHREEILDQSLATFRHALRDATFGEKWVGRARPQYFENVFASIQSLNRIDLANLDSGHFDVVIVDEFHHAAASSYTKLLSHLSPIELLGLTATPERADGLTVLNWFEGRICAELRLWDAIDQHRLSPFIYYGVHDGLDLRDVPWRRGRGYDIAELSNIYTANDVWVRRVIKELIERVEDPGAMRALGFCVSIQHAEFMAHHFNQAGIKAEAVWGDTPDDERKDALKKLSSSSISILFSVDLFNEGVDVPSVDTLLLLRPTESATLFLQQIGRGLRKSTGKSVCTILDFVGLHRREFRFDLKLSALLGGTRRQILNQVEQSFPLLPAGCHMELDHVASNIVLESIKKALPSRWSEKVSELRAMISGEAEVSLDRYLRETGLDLSDVYTGSKCWSDLLEDAGQAVGLSGAHEPVLRRSISRLLHVDDEQRLDFYCETLLRRDLPRLDTFNEQQRRLTRMLVASVCDQVLTKETSLEEAVELLWSHSQVISELHELFRLRRSSIDHLHVPLEGRNDCPLQVHARYTRIEIISAFGIGLFAKTKSWREGVLWDREEGVDIFVFTLDKSEGGFSPTTMYRDYAISRELIHWESQSGTSSNSPTGRRYQNHVRDGSQVMLFARQNSSERAFWFLGPATYVSHESERPMAVTWRLEYPLPGDLYSQFAAAAA